MSANGNKPHPGGHVRPASKVDVGNYTPTNILVTGGAGFIASHVVIGLVEKYPQYKVRLLEPNAARPPAWVTRLPPATADLTPVPSRTEKHNQSVTKFLTRLPPIRLNS